MGRHGGLRRDVDRRRLRRLGYESDHDAGLNLADRSRDCLGIKLFEQSNRVHRRHVVGRVTDRTKPMNVGGSFADSQHLQSLIPIRRYFSLRQGQIERAFSKAGSFACLCSGAAIVEHGVDCGAHGGGKAAFAPSFVYRPGSLAHELAAGRWFLGRHVPSYTPRHDQSRECLHGCLKQDQCKV